MKKIITLLLVAFAAQASFAQEGENDIKNFRFGVKISPSLNWYTPSNKKIEKDGVAGKLTGGLVAEYRLGKNFSWGFGLEFNGDGGKLTYKDTALYFISSDQEIITSGDTLTGKYSIVKLNERKYNAVYFMIPMNLKMKTKEIGMMKYYAQVGVNTYFRKSGKANDKGVIYPTMASVYSTTTSGQTGEETDLDVKKDISPVKFSANAAIGSEYNISGSTSLFFSLSYDYGLTNALKSNSEYLFRTRSNNNNPVNQKAISSAFLLNLGVLF